MPNTFTRVLTLAVVLALVATALIAALYLSVMRSAPGVNCPLDARPVYIRGEGWACTLRPLLP